MKKVLIALALMASMGATQTVTAAEGGECWYICCSCTKKPVKLTDITLIQQEPQVARNGVTL